MISKTSDAGWPAWRLLDPKKIQALIVGGKLVVEYGSQVMPKFDPVKGSTLFQVDGKPIASAVEKPGQYRQVDFVTGGSEYLLASLALPFDSKRSPQVEFVKADGKTVERFTATSADAGITVLAKTVDPSVWAETKVLPMRNGNTHASEVWAMVGGVEVDLAKPNALTGLADSQRAALKTQLTALHDLSRLLSYGDRGLPEDTRRRALDAVGLSEFLGTFSDVQMSLQGKADSLDAIARSL